MVCKKCGFVIPEGDSVCPKCGLAVNVGENSNTICPPSSDKKKKGSVWKRLSVVSLVCAAFTLFKGIHKMTAYDNGDYYPYDIVNAYVGGDAYNYIINGTYATAFFVLTTMFVLAAIGLMVIHYMSVHNNEKSKLKQ